MLKKYIYIFFNKNKYMNIYYNISSSSKNNMNKGYRCINQINRSRQNIIETIETFEEEDISNNNEYEHDEEQRNVDYISQNRVNINHKSYENVEEIGTTSNEIWYVYL